jgi:hypothetical protein
MDSELQKYEQLANPSPKKATKSKAPSISNTLSELTQKLQQARESLVNEPDATPQAIQQLFQDIFGGIETSKSQIDERLKETHASGMKMSKLIDKVPVIRPSVSGPPECLMTCAEKPNGATRLSTDIPRTRGTGCSPADNRPAPGTDRLA